MATKWPLFNTYPGAGAFRLLSVIGQDRKPKGRRPGDQNKRRDDQRQTFYTLLPGAMTALRVKGQKFKDLDRLNDQLARVLTRLGVENGMFEIREDYQKTGIIYLVFS